MRVIVTRPEEDAQRTAQALRDRGHESCIIPLLTIMPRAHITFADVNPQGLIITSANGVRMFAASDPRRNMPVYAVGAASAHEALSHGFQHVIVAEGDVASLRTLVARCADPHQGPLLHVAGQHVSGTLMSDLKAQGYDVIQRVAYEAVAVETLPERLREVLDTSDSEGWRGILFFSERTARIFCDRVIDAGLETSCHSLTAYCLSPHVEKALAPLHFRATRVADDKTQDALLDCLEGG